MPTLEPPTLESPSLESPSLESPLLESPRTNLQAETPIANRQTLPNQLDSAARDEGLINALEEQTNWQENRSTDDSNIYLTNPTTSASPNSQTDQSQNQSQYAISPQPGSFEDSSYNAMASDVTPTTPAESNVSFAGGSASSNALPIQSAWDQVEKLVEAERFKTALQVLSQYYRDPNLPGPQRQRLMAWLDALAGKVIFSDEDHLESAPYTVGNLSLIHI